MERHVLISQVSVCGMCLKVMAFYDAMGVKDELLGLMNILKQRSRSSSLSADIAKLNRRVKVTAICCWSSLRTELLNQKYAGDGRDWLKGQKSDLGCAEVGISTCVISVNESMLGWC